MNPGDDLRIAAADHPGPVIVHHNELITALAALVVKWECEVEITLAPTLVSALAALRASGTPYALIHRSEPRTQERADTDD